MWKLFAADREMIWRQVQEQIGEGDAIMAWSAPNEAGYDFDTCGFNRRMPVDLDGFKVVQFTPPVRPTAKVSSEPPENVNLPVRSLTS